MEPLPSALINRRKVEEVFRNLVSNAIKFMGDQPRPRIEIGAKRLPHEYHLFVRDNGIGIEPQYHEKIFDLFYRPERIGEGTGIGLSIVRGSVKDLGGKVWVRSQLGKGNTFWFSVPKDST